MGIPGPDPLAARIDHTLLSPAATPADVERLCAQAAQYAFHAVCLAPWHVPRAKELLSGTGVAVATVVGFPLGFQAGETKAAEAAWAVGRGADELDMVLNVGALKAGRIDVAAKDVAGVVQAARGAVVKVIIETGLLTDAEKRLACGLIRDAGADFVKTCTGFGPGQATVEDVRLLKQSGRGLLVKASGGIRTREQAEALVAAGADRLGASASVDIMALPGHKGTHA